MFIFIFKTIIKQIYVKKESKEERTQMNKKIKIKIIFLAIT